MLIGEYKSRIGEKKRIALPKKIRDELKGNLILTRGYENSLVLVDKKLWKNIAGELISGSFINSKIRDTSRFLIGSAVEISLDTQGRFIVPELLKEYAKLNKDVIFIGLINWVEIWSKRLWDQRVRYLTENSKIIADELSKMTENQK